jgi:large subunit ribosomal protein L23
MIKMDTKQKTEKKVTQSKEVKEKVVKTKTSTSSVAQLKFVKYPVSTEKSLKAAEYENKLIFVVDLRATKTNIKKELEAYFNVKIKAINTVITTKGLKKAYVTFADSVKATDLATNLGMI